MKSAKDAVGFWEQIMVISLLDLILFSLILLNF